jgi:ABC-2 type transport system ATP-binding protein
MTTRTDQRSTGPGHRTQPAIEATSVSRSYGSHRALAGVDLRVEAGETVAILGPNGAGKTTLVEILEGLRRRDAGEVTVLGSDPARADGRWRARIGAVLQLGTEADELTVAEMVRAHAAYYPSPGPMADVIDALDLGGLADQRVRRLSGGQRRRLDIALGVIGRPELLFLDEPTTGLDPEVRRSIWALIRSLAEAGTTVVLTTHYLDEVEHLAERTVVLVDGRAVWRGPTADLRAGSSTGTVTFTLTDPGAAARLPADLPGTRLPADLPTVGYETSDPTALVAALMAWAAAVEGPSPIGGLEVGRPSLEEAYLDLLNNANDRQEPTR